MNFQNRSSAILLLLSLTLFSACSTTVKNLNTPEGTMAEGDRLLRNGFYDEAREQYYRIKTEFPASSLQVQADLKIADAYFEEESWAAAAASYEDFVKTYPGRPELEYAVFRLGKSYQKQMPGNPGRDSRSTRQMLDAFTRLVVDFPQSEHAEEAYEYIEIAQKQLAEKTYRVGRFYEKTDKYLAAAGRYEEVATMYPEHKLAEESMARQVRMLREAGKSDQSDALARKFQERFPGSEFNYMIQP